MSTSEEYLEQLLKSMTDEPIIEEPVIEEEPIIEEPVIEEEPIIEEPVIEEEPIIEEPVIEEEPIIEEPVIEEEPIIEEPDFEDELPELEANETGISKSEEMLQDEDISNLLASLGELDAEPQPEEAQPEPQAEEPEIAFSPEEAAFEEEAAAPDADVTELLDQISDDSELNEINELLKKNDNHESVEDDDMLALLEKATGDGDGIDGEDVFAIEEPLEEDGEDSDTEDGDKKGKRTRKKKEKRAKKEKSEKKPGFFARLFNSLTEEELSEESAEEVKNLFDEIATTETLEDADNANQELLEEMEEEDNGKKGKKGKKNKKEKKEKAPKEKKPKKIKEPKPEQPPGKKLPKKHIIVIGIMCASIGILMTAIAFYYPYYQDMRQAVTDYQEQNYESAYECLTGHHLNEEEQTLYQKTVLMLRLDRKYQSYLNYTTMGMNMEAFNALLQGMEAADQYMEQAEVLGIMQEYRVLQQQIEDMLSNQYGVSPDLAREWLAIEDSQLYSRTISDYLLGTNTLNMQTADGQPYEAGTESKGEQTPEQPDNPIIAGEEEEFGGTDQSQTENTAETGTDQGTAESGTEQEAAGTPQVVDSIQSEPPAQSGDSEQKGGKSAQNVDELFENSTVEIR